MPRFFVCLWLFAGMAWAQAPAEKPGSDIFKPAVVAKAAPDAFKKDVGTLASAVDGAVAAAIPNRGPFQNDSAKTTYLDGYGLIVTIETALEPPHNIFSAPKSAAETKTIMNQRLADIEERLQNVLKEKVGKLQSVGDMESVTIVVYLFNSNPDIPNFPSQVVFTAKKNDPTRVTVVTP